ncbi:MAG: TadE/TadG family type IV pilus assembly protein [Massilia sp.]
MMRTRSLTANQSGQAMVEFIVAALFFLIPLFLAIVVLGKFVDVQHTTQMAGRYAAWERTVWYDDSGTAFDAINGSNQKSATEIGHEIGMRLINDRSQRTSVIKNTDRSATSFANGSDPLWRDNAHAAYLDRYEQQDSAVTRTGLSTDVTSAATEALGAFSIPGVTGSLAPPVPRDTFAVARVQFREVAKNSAAYQRLWPRDGVWGGQWNGLNFSATGAILSNTWYANGSGATKQMVEASVPMAQAGVKGPLDVMIGATMIPWEPGAPRPELGKVAPDVVPGDRLR